MFKLGQALGNAYGNLWVANANKRDDKKIEDIKNKLGNVTSQDVADALGGETVLSPVADGMSVNDVVGAGQQGIAPQQNIIRSASDVMGPQAIGAGDLPKATGVNWRPSFSASDLDKAMQAQGIGKSSRDRALAQYKQEVAQQAQQEMLPGLMDSLGGENPRAALRGILQYSQYDPTMSNVLMKDYERAVAFDNQQKLKAQELANKMAYAEAYGRGGRGGSGGGGRGGVTGVGLDRYGNIKPPDEKKLLELVNDYRGMFEGASEAEKPQVARMLASAQAELEALRRGANSWYAYKYGNAEDIAPQESTGRVVGVERAGDNGRGRDVDIDDYDDIKSFIDSLPKGKRQEAIQGLGKAIQNKYGENYLDNDMYRAVWGTYNDGKAPWQSDAEYRRQVLKDDNWDKVNEQNAQRGQSPLGRFFSNEYWDDLQKKNSGRK